MNGQSHLREPYFEQDARNEHYYFQGDDFGLPLIYHCGYNNLNQASRLTWHSHSGFEFVFVIEGSAFYEFDNGDSLEVVGGEYFVNLPGQRHRGRLDMSTPSKMCWIVFDPGVPDAVQNTTFDESDLVLIAEQCLKSGRKISAFGHTLKLLLTLFSETVKAGHSAYFTQWDAVRIRSLLCQIILEATVSLNNISEKKSLEIVESIKRELEENYASELNLDKIARVCGLHRSQFYSVFKAVTGQTPLDYLQRQRIKQAQSLLLTTRSSITDIAINTGFNSSQYFSRVFRRYTGCTPGDFRQHQN